MIIAHYTKQDFAENIAKFGFDIARKHEAKASDEYDVYFDSYHGATRKLAKDLSLNNAHFFVIDDDSHISAVYGVDSKVIVNSGDLDPEKLFVANAGHGVRLFDAVQKKDLWSANKIKRQYWQDFFSFRYFVKHKQEISKESVRKYGIPYMAEVLYFGSIPPGKIKIVPYPKREAQYEFGKISFCYNL